MFFTAKPSLRLPFRLSFLLLFISSLNAVRTVHICPGVGPSAEAGSTYHGLHTYRKLTPLPAHNCQSHHSLGSFLLSCERRPKVTFYILYPNLGFHHLFKGPGIFGEEQYFEGRIWATVWPFSMAGTGSTQPIPTLLGPGLQALGLECRPNPTPSPSPSPQTPI